MRFIGVILVLAASHLEAADWHWRPQVAASGDGRSYETAWRHVRQIQWAQMQPGDRLCLHGASMGAHVEVLQPLNVQSDDITISGACGKEPGTIAPGDGSSYAGNTPMVIVNNRTRVTIEDIAFRNTNRALEINGGSNHTLRRLTIDHTGGKAISILGSTTGVRVQSVTIRDAEDGVYFITPKTPPQQHANCEVSGSYFEKLWGKDGHAVGFQGSPQGCRVHHNVAVDTGQAYVLYAWNNGLKMERNVLEYNSAQNSPRCFSIGGDNYTPVDAINDNIIRFNRCSDSREGIYVKSQYQSPTRWAVRLKGNEFVGVLTPMLWNNPQHGSAPGTRYGVLVE
jgi:hypothetical protein